MLCLYYMLRKLEVCFVCSYVMDMSIILDLKSPVSLTCVFFGSPLHEGLCMPLLLNGSETNVLYFELFLVVLIILKTVFNLVSLNSQKIVLCCLPESWNDPLLLKHVVFSKK
jgi:hypothetical protein